MTVTLTIKETEKKPIKRDHKGRFIKGSNAGKGRPKGSPDRRTAPFRQKIMEALPEILDSLIEQAKKGDIQAAKIIIDKTIPTIKPTEQAHAVALHGNSLTDKAASIVDAVSLGALSIDEASRLLQALGSVARIVETDELERRLSALEAA